MRRPEVPSIEYCRSADSDPLLLLIFHRSRTTVMGAPDPNERAKKVAGTKTRNDKKRPTLTSYPGKWGRLRLTSLEENGINSNFTSRRSGLLSKLRKSTWTSEAFVISGTITETTVNEGENNWARETKANARQKIPRCCQPRLAS